MTYDPIASTTLTSSASSVTFSSLDTIAAGYRDLVLVVGNLKMASGSGSIQLQLNGDTGSNYSTVTAEGYSAGTNSSNYSGNAYMFAWNYYNITTSNPSSVIVNFNDFSATDKHKTALIRSSLETGSAFMAVGRWANTVAVTSITVKTGANLYASGATFSLYGIVA